MSAGQTEHPCHRIDGCSRVGLVACQSARTSPNHLVTERARFIRRQKYAHQAALGLTIGGLPAVFLAAYVVVSLPLTTEQGRMLCQSWHRRVLRLVVSRAGLGREVGEFAVGVAAAVGKRCVRGALVWAVWPESRSDLRPVS